MTIEYTPKGVCSRKITVEVEDGIVKSVVFTGGGDLQYRAEGGWFRVSGLLHF